VRFAFDNGVAVYGGVNNLTNQEPDLGEDFYPVSAVGRFWYLGAAFNRFWAYARGTLPRFPDAAHLRAVSARSLPSLAPES
jgi:hypothetical protein